MGRSSVFLLVSTVVLALAGAIAGAAVAGLPTLLPETATITTTASTSSVTKLITLSGLPIECAKQESTATVEKEGKLGAFHFDFKECSTKVAGITVKCTGLSEAIGVVLALGEFHLVYDKLGTGSALGVGILFLYPSTSEAHYECASTLILVKGAVLCLVTPVGTKVKTTEFYTLQCEQKGGDQVESYWNSAGTATILPSLLRSSGGGTAESSALEGVMKLTSTVETEIDG